jgi:hypothetical protein
VSSLPVSTDVGPLPPGCQITPTSLSFTTNISYGEYERLAKQLLSAEQSIQWWLGDLLNYGERAYGERYAQAADLSGRTVSTLSNWMWVAERFPASRRRDGVRWTMHREVAKLDPDEQDQWLGVAESEGWSREQLVSSLRNTPSGDSPPRTPSLQPAPASPLGREEVEADSNERVVWTIRISVPETSSLIDVESAIQTSADALRSVLVDDIHADPEVFVALDVSG